MTTTTLRPDSTIAVGSAYTGSGSGTLHGATSDNSDVTYIREMNSTKLGFTTTTLPAGAVTSTLTPRAKVSHGTVVVSGLFTAQLDTFTNTGLTSLERTTAPRPYAATQAQVDALQCTLQAPIDPRLYELYLDLVYVARPVTTVTAVSPDPYTASTIVPISWANTLDADGGAQTHRQIRVFTAAQYGAGGFDPATSDATFDSGEVVTGFLNGGVGPLVSGTTYRAYVRVAQTVNGAKHWSAYAFDQFTVTVSTSDVSSVVATPVDADGKIGVVVTRSGGSTAWELVEIERTIDAGVTWSTVRFATLVDSTGNASTFSVDDYEVANGQTVKYRARATYYNSGLPITGAWVESSSVSWSGRQWLKDPVDPSLNIQMEAALWEPQSRNSRSGVFYPLGSSDAIVVSDKATAATGSLTLRAAGSDGMLALDRITENSRVLLVNMLPASATGPNRDGFQYVAPLSTSESWMTRHLRDKDGDTEIRLVTIPFVTTTAPPDPTAGSL